MYLRVSIFLFILLTGGFGLVCYDCQGPKGITCEKNTTCDDEQSMCITKRIIEYSSSEYGDKVEETIERSCATTYDCEIWYITTGNSFQCCDTDLCNEQDDIDFSYSYYDNVAYYDHDEKKCFTCDEEDCSDIQSCVEDEDYCFTAKGNQPNTVKGCASKYICDCPLKWLGPGYITCCEGNLFNGTQSVTQSFMFLCYSLLSFILLH
ncbi:uncharacterized protein LOC113097297 [Carassius auratus]|uniref:Uncharacterized protein LOC113097297 n=1 Tax=Carassius auratus TaxID=7957 RepID=A0A6P6PAP8_CARAU|nr:uncharacterized protein LOC113097297 [Carassius auratus]